MATIINLLPRTPIPQFTPSQSKLTIELGNNLLVNTDDERINWEDIRSFQIGVETGVGTNKYVFHDCDSVLNGDTKYKFSLVGNGHDVVAIEQNKTTGVCDLILRYNELQNIGWGGLIGEGHKIVVRFMYDGPPSPTGKGGKMIVKFDKVFEVNYDGNTATIKEV